VRGNNTTEIWIGGVQIQSVPEETEALVQGRDSVRCEYTVMADDVQRRAYPVTIDDKSIEDLFGEERVKGGQKNSTSWRFRDITRREHRALFGGYGVMAGVFLLPAFFSFIAGLDSLLSFYDLEAALPFLITGAFFSVLSTVLLLMKPG
ncbi:MAG: hypothetical protein PQJ50_05955, partial [Spirochaetales bacterium]|nr:hypothetical protein [Spirochaetales bacterium]